MRSRSLGWLIVALVFVGGVLGGCSRDAAPPTDTTPGTSTSIQEPSDVQPATSVDATTPWVATVNGTPVIDAAIERAEQQVLLSYQQLYAQFGMDISSFLSGAQGRLFTLRITNEALELATTRTLIRDELARREAQVPDEVVDEELEGQYQQLLVALGMTSDEFRMAFDSGGLTGLNTGGLTFDQFMEAARLTVREELELQEARRLVAGEIEFTEADLRLYFEDNRSNYDVAEQVSASHILVDTAEEAQQVLDELAAGADFAALARERSTDTGSAPVGGALGWFARGRMVQAFEDAAFSTPVGEISDIVETQYGYHIIWVTGHRDEETPDYEGVAEAVLADYESEIRAERFNDWYAVIRPTAAIEIQDAVLAAYRLQQEDAEQGLAAFLALRGDETVNEPYLEYIIGVAYESLMQRAVTRKQTLEQSEQPLTAEQQTELAALEADIATQRELAIDAYRRALEALGEDDQIQSRLDVLVPADE